MEGRILSPTPRNLFAAYIGFSKATVHSSWVHRSLKGFEGDVVLLASGGERGLQRIRAEAWTGERAAGPTRMNKEKWPDVTWL